MDREQIEVLLQPIKRKFRRLRWLSLLASFCFAVPSSRIPFGGPYIADKVLFSLIAFPMAEANKAQFDRERMAWWIDMSERLQKRLHLLQVDQIDKVMRMVSFGALLSFASMVAAIYFMAWATTTPQFEAPPLFVFIGILSVLAVVAITGISVRKAIEKTVASFGEEIADLSKDLLSLMHTQKQ